MDHFFVYSFILFEVYDPMIPRVPSIPPTPPPHNNFPYTVIIYESQIETDNNPRLTYFDFSPSDLIEQLCIFKNNFNFLEMKLQSIHEIDARPNVTIHFDVSRTSKEPLEDRPMTIYYNRTA